MAYNDLRSSIDQQIVDEQDSIRKERDQAKQQKGSALQHDPPKLSPQDLGALRRHIERDGNRAMQRLADDDETLQALYQLSYADAQRSSGGATS